MTRAQLIEKTILQSEKVERCLRHLSETSSIENNKLIVTHLEYYVNFTNDLINHQQKEIDHLQEIIKIERRKNAPLLKEINDNYNI